MNPALFAPIIGGISSLFGGLFNNKSSDSRQEALMRYNSLEAQKARDFNAKQSELSFDRQLQLLQYINDYNSPASMMARLKQAGLNPNLALGSLNGGASSSPSVNSASGPAASVSPVFTPPVDTASLSSSFNQIADAQLKQAEAAKVRSETDVLRSDARFRDAFNQGVLDLQNVQINCGNVSALKDTQSISESRFRCSNLEASTKQLYSAADNLAASTANLEADTIYKGFQNMFASRQFSLLCDKLAAEVSLSKAEARSVLAHIAIDTMLARSQNSVNLQTSALRMAEAENVKKQTDLILPKTSASLQITNDQLLLNYGDSKKTHEFINGLKTWGAAIDIGTRVLGTASMFLPGPAGTVSRLGNYYRTTTPSY